MADGSNIIFTLLAIVAGGFIGGILGYRARTSEQAETSLQTLEPFIVDRLQRAAQNTQAARNILPREGPGAAELIAALHSTAQHLAQTSQDLLAQDIFLPDYFRPALSALSVEQQNQVRIRLQSLHSISNAVLGRLSSIGSPPYRTPPGIYGTILLLVQDGERALLRDDVGYEQARAQATQEFTRIFNTLQRLSEADATQLRIFAETLNTILTPPLVFMQQGHPVTLSRSNLLSGVHAAMRAANIS